MLSLNEIHAKVRELEQIAARVPEPGRTHYLALALNWRLIEVELVFIGAMKSCLDEERG